MNVKRIVEVSMEIGIVEARLTALREELAQLTKNSRKGKFGKIHKGSKTDKFLNMLRGAPGHKLPLEKARALWGGKFGERLDALAERGYLKIEDNDVVLTPVRKAG